MIEDTVLLIGNLEESFYQLGQKDREHWQGKKHHQLHKFSGKIADLGVSWSPIVEGILKNYAEGAQVPDTIIKYSIIQREIQSANLGPAHLIFDGPASFYQVVGKDLSGVNTSAMAFYTGKSKFPPEILRTIHYKLSSHPNAIALSNFTGPLANPNALTSNGLQLSVSLCTNSKIELKKRPVHDLFNQILLEVDDLKEAIKLVKKSELLVQASFLLYTSQSDIAFQLVGGHGDWFINEIPLEMGSSYWIDQNINNKKDSEVFPLAESYEQIDQSDWKKNTKTKLKKPEHLLKTLFPKSNSHPFGLGSPKFFFGVQSLPAENKLIFLNPLSENSTHLSSHTIGQGLSKNESLKKDPEISLFKLYWDKASRAYLNNDEEIAYHYLQLSLTCKAEQIEKTVLQFYFLVWQYLKTKGAKELGFLYKELIQLYPNLPHNFQDHAMIIAQRLQCQLSMGQDDFSHQFKNQQILNRYNKEKNWDKAHISIANKMTWPRLDLGDIGHFI